VTTSLRALGQLAAKLTASGGLYPSCLQLASNLQQMLSRAIATQRITASLVISFWENAPKQHFEPALNSALSEQGGFEELTPFVLALQKDCHVSSLRCHVMHLLSCDFLNSGSDSSF